MASDQLSSVSKQKIMHCACSITIRVLARIGEQPSCTLRRTGHRGATKASVNEHSDSHTSNIVTSDGSLSLALGLLFVRWIRPDSMTAQQTGSSHSDTLVWCAPASLNSCCKVVS